MRRPQIDVHNFANYPFSSWKIMTKTNHSPNLLKYSNVCVCVGVGGKLILRLIYFYAQISGDAIEGVVFINKQTQEQVLSPLENYTNDKNNKNTRDTR